MELEDQVVYNSNVAYHVCGDDNRQQHVNATNDYDTAKIPTKASNSNKATNKTKVLITMVILLLLILTLLMALSVVTITQLNSKQSTLQSLLNKADNDIRAVLTQLVTTHNNISQKLFQFDTKINNIVSLMLQNSDMEPQLNCGPGLWYQVAHLNMSDPSQQCPSVWKEYTQNGIRACGRPSVSIASCATKRYLTSNQYSRVCGRVIGFSPAC